MTNPASLYHCADCGRPVEPVCIGGREYRPVRILLRRMAARTGQ